MIISDKQSISDQKRLKDVLKLLDQCRSQVIKVTESNYDIEKIFDLDIKEFEEFSDICNNSSIVMDDNIVESIDIKKKKKELCIINKYNEFSSLNRKRKRDGEDLIQIVDILNACIKIYFNPLEVLSIIDVWRTNFYVKSSIDSIGQELNDGLESLERILTLGLSEIILGIEQQNEISLQMLEALSRPVLTRAKDLRTRGIEAYNLGFYKQSIRCFKRAMIEDPIDHISTFYMGNVYLYIGDYDKAIRFYGEAVQYSEPYSDKFMAISLMHLAFAYYHSGGIENWKVAAECMLKALNIEPYNPEFKYQYAQYLALSGDKAEALLTLDFLIKKDYRYILRVCREVDFISIYDDFLETSKILLRDIYGSAIENIDFHKKIITDLLLGKRIYPSEEFRKCEEYRKDVFLEEMKSKEAIFLEGGAYSPINKVNYKIDSLGGLYLQNLKNACLKLIGETSILGEDDIFQDVPQPWPIEKIIVFTFTLSYPNIVYMYYATACYSFWGIGSDLL